MNACLLPGLWHCVACGRKYRLKHVPGVLTVDPVDLPDSGCPRCGGAVQPFDARARVTESNIASNVAATEAYR